MLNRLVLTGVRHACSHAMNTVGVAASSAVAYIYIHLYKYIYNVVLYTYCTHEISEIAFRT
jgi:hypothetical protein